MPQYHTLGTVPHKRHTQFRKPDGSLYSEELFSTHGFSSVYSLIYHCYPPTLIKEVSEPYSVEPEIAYKRHLKHESFAGFSVPPADDYLESRKAVLVNSDVHLSLASPKKSVTSYFYKNADADEVLFIHEGEGVMKSIYGSLPFSYGDYIVIPRGTIYQLEFKNENNRLFIIESFSAIETPKRYRNAYGQFEEHAPYCERDIRKPMNLETHDEKGDFMVKIKKQGMMYDYVYATHPFDAIGWDGNHYPWVFSIHDFEPLTGRIHLPPPVHQTFEAHNFVVCSFCPRLFDYHPMAIPAPYNHSNIDSDEVIYYVDGDFMSRKNVTRGMITLHPAGILHGPHPGAVEKSIGAKETKELAVMVDTFRPLQLTKQALEIENKGYIMSWAE